MECCQCKTPNALFRCARCCRARYCNSACQKLNWQQHKNHCLSSGTQQGIARIDSEAAIAPEYMQKNSGFFRGCTNCGSSGIYFTTCAWLNNYYSTEGLCYTCELQKFPDRYQGCTFCRSPYKNSYTCLPCGDGFQGWVRAMEHKREYKDGREDTRIISTATQAAHMIYTKERPKFPFSIQHDTGYKKWPGFYVGNNKWYIPQGIVLHLEDMNWDNKDAVLRRELERHGIFVNQEFQFQLKEH